MFRHTSIKYTLLFLILFLLVLYPKICINGATRGLLLWFNTVLPTLFPFFLVTRLILSLNLIPRRLSGLYPVMTGLIAGYPTGAATIAQLIKSGKMNINQGQLLMIISNNASPGFLIGIAGCICDTIPAGTYYLWFCTILSSAAVTIMYGIKGAMCSSRPSRITPDITDVCDDVCIDLSEKNNTAFLNILENTMFECFRLLVLIGGYIIIFSILADFSGMIVRGYLPHSIIAGLFEITTGITLITSEPDSLPVLIKGTAAAALCGFGGISALLQTSGVIRDSGLSLSKYAFHKILCGITCGVLFYISFQFLL